MMATNQSCAIPKFFYFIVYFGLSGCGSEDSITFKTQLCMINCNCFSICGRNWQVLFSMYYQYLMWQHGNCLKVTFMIILAKLLTTVDPDSTMQVVNMLTLPIAIHYDSDKSFCVASFICADRSWFQPRNLCMTRRSPVISGLWLTIFIYCDEYQVLSHRRFATAVLKGLEKEGTSGSSSALIDGIFSGCRSSLWGYFLSYHSISYKILHIQS